MLAFCASLLVLVCVIKTVDYVIGLEHFRIRNGNSTSNVSSKILSSMEDILSKFYANRRVFQAAGSNLALSVFSCGGNLPFVQTGGILRRWQSNITALFNGTSKKDTFSSFDEIEAGILLPDSNNWSGNYLALAFYKNFHYEDNFDVVSPVIDVFLAGGPLYDVDPPIQLIFKVHEMQQNTSYVCVVWDQALNHNCGGWSKRCASHYLDSEHMRCSCDRLKRFAVISELRSYSEKYASVVFLRDAMYISWISLQFGLLTIIMTFILFRQYRKKLKHKVLFNLSLSLFVFKLTMTAGLERRNSSVLGCAVVAVFLHYILLASFAWMLVEAYVQYHTLVKVVGTYIPRFMQKASLFAWGLPLLNIGVLLSIDYTLYISDITLCWPKVKVNDKAFYYGVAVQAGTMWAMTLVVFVLILHSTCGINTKGLRSHKNERKAKIARVQVIFCVSVLLGISWIYGLVNVYGNWLFIQYIYAVALTLLGIFIFIYFVFVCKETRQLWSSAFLNKQTIAKDIPRIEMSILPSANTRNRH